MDIEKQKVKAKTLISSIDARMQSRFMKGEKLPTLHILASSKRTDQSFLETYIDMKKKNESKTTLIIDEPQWVIRTDKDSPNKFNVAVGNKFLNSEVLPLDISDDDLQNYIDRGYKILKVPMGYYEQFLDDIDIALTDIAGISTSNSSRFISGPRLAPTFVSSFKNAFIKDVIEVGNAVDDDVQYYQYFDLDRIDKQLKSKPLYIHLDMSMSGDKTGIAGVWIIGKKPSQAEGLPSRDLFFRVPFVVSVKAPKGYQVSFEKNRNFIRWLKQNGFNIKGVSSDTFQSADLQQQLKAEGFNCQIISVDRLQDHICLPYQYLKSTIYEQRIEFPKNTLLQEEFLGLQKDGNGKVDHDPSGINCFTGDTKIRLLDGRSVPIKVLVDEYKRGIQNWVYSIDHDNKCIVPKLITKAWCSGKNAKLVEVTLDNGEKIHCTPEHKFMLRDGSYEQAQHLLSGDSLMPLYTKVSNKGLSGYRLYYQPYTGKWHYEHRQFAEEVYDCKYLVHHKNCNPSDNSPTNLIWMSHSAYMLEHAHIQTGAQSAEARKKRSISVKESHNRAKSTDQGYLRYYSGSIEEREQKYQKNLKVKQEALNRIARINEYFSIDFESLSEELQRRYLGKWANLKAGIAVEKELSKCSCKERTDDTVQLQEAACKYYEVDKSTLTSSELHSYVMKYTYATKEGYKAHIASEVSKNHKLGKYEKAREALANRIWYTNGIDNVYIKSSETPPQGFHRGRTVPHKNHKVVSVRVLDTTEDVFDLEIEGTHNFALDAGIFVHNSKDSADAVCGATWFAQQNAEQFAFDYGEMLDTITEVSKSTSQEYQIKEMNKQFEEQLSNQLNPLRNLDKETLSESDQSRLYLSQGIVIF